MTNENIIDTGTAPEFFADDFGEITVEDHHVTWKGTRNSRGSKLVVVSVVIPLGAIPSVAATFVALFAGQLTRRVTDKLRQIAGFTILG